LRRLPRGEGDLLDAIRSTRLAAEIDEIMLVVFADGEERH
jgi:hypothetical protein